MDRRSALVPFCVGLLLAFALLASTAVYGIETVKLADGRVMILWTPEEMAKLEAVLEELVKDRREFLRLRKACT
jgi:hypothetical protein